MQVDSTWSEYAFEHVALPELDAAQIDTSVTFLGKQLRAPLLISCMTGGTDEAARINQNLAIAAERCGVAFGVGSQRKALEDSEQARTFEVREALPTMPLIGNLGAVQLNYGCGVEACEAAVEMIGADALALHLNPLQEAIQPEGQSDFSDLLPKIKEVCERLSVPVIVKEVGCGLSGEVGQKLADVGVKILDSAGLGGTSWARIEASRAGDLDTGELFADWGIHTPESILQLSAIPGVSVIGSGGVRNGLDCAKALALGADLVGAAYPFLAAAVESPEKVADRIDRTVEELRICMFCTGTRTIRGLREATLRRKALET
ncbi:MAG: type 2 isopentenyl-diphosphate Delta-isomerase [Planctomycetes bacterium]|nr:type 2 isopentenyl-diphosphate Delta-isomerase [Planctomycetota bacterium]